MDSVLQERCDKLVEITNRVCKAFPFVMNGFCYSAAATLLDMEEIPTVEELKAAEKLIYSKTKIFSEFRDSAKLALVCRMILSGDPEGYFDKVNEVFKMLSEGKIVNNEYRAFAAINICSYLGDQDPRAVVDRTNEIYAKMNENHKVLTSAEDIPMAALHAVTNVNVEKLVEEMELDYKALKDKFGASGTLQSLSHVTALSHIPSEIRCEKVIKLWDMLKEHKNKYNKANQIIGLGLFTLIDVPAEVIVDELIETEKYLEKQKGFGSFSLDNDTRRMLAAELVYSTHASSDKTIDGMALGSTVASLIALDLLLIMTVVTTTVIFSSSSH